MKYGKMVATVLLTMGGLMVAAPDMQAAEEKIELKASDTMKEILGQRVGKRVTLRLESGENLEGTVTMVGNSLVHIARLAGKDYFDAVVTIDRISAVLIQVRGR
jgi:hypothetical protein